ncbi:hypothetical protein GCM10009765_67180 [Fodinicola feengrottensis]|uniref:Glycosyl hydrolase family 32 N-terminal domain-containing protein n=1 Tax=Fodinicola feengrottensis TaxID=435914 RepID=A0ABP4UM88_9ACTN
MTHTTPELRVTGKKVLFEGVADVTVTHRRGREWMALGSMTPGDKAIGLQSAHIQRNSGEWSIDSTPLAKFPPAHAWDATGYHCASYVRGRVDGEWRGRIYYASSSSWTDITGPYQIGFLEFDGTGWRRHSEPVFQASLPWERGTVLEPNLVYEGGLWRMWYCTGLSTSEPPTIGYAESADGITDWRGRKVVSTGNFDAAVTAIDGGYAMVTARHNLTGPPSDGGLYLSYSEDLASWSPARQILSALDGTPWHRGGVWKPSVRYESGLFTVFFNASEPRSDSYVGKLSVGQLDFYSS